MTAKTIRASELPQFLFCKRAWWYAQEGFPSDDGEQMAGTHWHDRHGRVVLEAGCLRILGYAFLIAAFVTGAAYLTTRLLG
ncbi:MAG: hypothetical protein GTO14_05060 [Anaerolineales bacterium]|nr:hypothetical protein [Anaerolineales bacterium]